MLYELDKIDTMRYDNKDTITVYILDMDMWKGKYDEHVYYTQKKVELCVNYILTGDAAKYYNVSPELISHYDISIISQEMRVPVDYLQLIQNIAADIKSSYGELIRMDDTVNFGQRYIGELYCSGIHLLEEPLCPYL